ncbi:hypothetical protein QG37_02431 [Candidozyma auris]|uniref:Uncharacterized protein n=1 Tax=Candidozyma auris TaxID=498019 RepID=A0A0L0P1Z1_CANAR|nr:hypothetical protein QG37_02431 [[Candida] auris]
MGRMTNGSIKAEEAAAAAAAADTGSGQGRQTADNG